MNTVEKTKNDIPFAELSAYHRKLEEKYKNQNPEELTAAPETIALMDFNGYYAMNSATGAFFSIDTNIHVQSGSSSPIYDVALIVSLDGKSSTRVSFTGSFDGSHLKQSNPNGFELDLTFSRSNLANGLVASFTGSISLEKDKPFSVSGSTYNNPIQYSMYIGTYFETEPLHLSTSKKTEVQVPVLKIEKDYTLMFDYGSNDGNLKKVPSFTYNLNMYYFSFSKGSQDSKLIMGTAAAKGFACNNMIVDGEKLVSRSLNTIPFPTQNKLKVPNLMSEDLAQFSAYYPLDSIAPGAFLSVQAQYENIVDGIDIYEVMISLSMDGKSSTGYYFEEEKMSFSNGILSMPEQSISLAFKREYNAQFKSLMSIQGMIQGHAIDTQTPFNPVPLLAFGGATMSNSSNDRLSIQGKNELTYNGTAMKSIIYVPLMYIMAYPVKDPSIVMSFGTDGKKGNTCIVTDLTVKPPKVSVVYAIPE